MSEIEPKRQLVVAVPKGEMGGVVQKFLENRASLGIQYPMDRKLFFESSDGIFFTILRAKGLPEDVGDPDTEICAGIITSDSAKNSGFPKNRQRRRMLSVDIPPEKKSRVVLAGTIQFKNNIEEGGSRQMALNDFEGQTIYTSYPNLARDFFEQHNVTGVRIKERPGSIEAYPQFTKAAGVVDVTVTGNSLRDNGLAEVAQVHGPVLIEFIYDPDKFKKMDSKERRKLAAFSRSLRKPSTTVIEKPNQA